VENLAVLSKESTQKISTLISEVQTDIEKAVVEVTTTNVSIDEQATSLKLTDDSFNLIQESVFELKILFQPLLHVLLQRLHLVQVNLFEM